MSESQYIHGSDPDERQRLSRLNELLNDACLAELSLRGGENILDVGSGLGQFTRAMARAARRRATGVERDPAQIAEAIRQATAAGEQDLIEFRQGDAHLLRLSPLEWGSFDVVHTRFLLEHVPDPLVVVQAMARAVRPGGRVVLADDDHAIFRLWPEPPGSVLLWRAYMQSYTALGNDPETGVKLVQWLYSAGLKPVRNKWLWFGACSAEDTFRVKLQNKIKIISGARDVMLSHRLISESELDSALKALSEWGDRPDAAMWFAFNWAEGLRPATGAL
ncbi:MAG: class I SAM-dependent methyltransferase [Candidatus Acidiferrales bacterium]